ncbi:uncharacterized metal-binding protein YceD (DUF177 family) [Pseudochelatococcus lubricantis]|uniref:Uncharacterized metal-binding protein YceD (DUF177 family) n=1 Tax=Pseudochelatococcus lubricantis TaxID=1538102 RepID=A0ABX0UXD5_9HYPH|nr:DUF177 domain-containing protein [Pseudochelatococcus lubricantis]NIJ56544.1 uncharacterized metal-binding protein YceD (DUF177 family) [Pseudochelatococcus lubricantis]
MTDTESFPLQRVFNVADLKPEGVDFTVETTPEERAALAAFLDLPAIHALTGAFHLSGNDRRVTVRGDVRAAIVQTCTVSLEPFDASVHEEVEVMFADPELPQAEPREPRDPESELDAPDDLIDGQIDLGALTAEFLALGLDPYPRKPGVEFLYDDGVAGNESPFAALSGLKQAVSGNKE